MAFEPELLWLKGWWSQHEVVCGGGATHEGQAALCHSQQTSRGKLAGCHAVAGDCLTQCLALLSLVLSLLSAPQVRLNGENPAKDFQPCPGVLGEVVFPTHMDGVRVDSWLESGTEISPYYDSLLGKLMVHAPTRELAVAKIQEALAGRTARLAGGSRESRGRSRGGDSQLAASVQWLFSAESLRGSRCLYRLYYPGRASHTSIQRRQPEDRNLPETRGCVC